MPEQATSNVQGKERVAYEAGCRDWDTVAVEFNKRNKGKEITTMAARNIHARAIRKLREQLAELLGDIQ